MRKVAAVLGVVVIANSYAFGGIVEFSKGEFNVLAPDLVRLDVTVVGENQYDFADILFASYDVSITGLEFSAEWTDAFSFVADPVFDLVFGSPGSDLFSTSTNATPVGPTLFMGMLVVDPRGFGLTLADLGTELLVVIEPCCIDPQLSQVGMGGVNEALFGFGIINVVPEPGTFSLLGLAALGLIRRRRKSA